MPVIELVAPGSRTRSTWAGGRSEEIARWGEASGGWRARLSVATIERAARFTPMPGRRRWLAVLDDGGGLVLRRGGQALRLATGAHLAFTGDEPIEAEPGPRPARVWNAIVGDEPGAVGLVAAVATTPSARRFDPGVLAIHALDDVTVELGGGVRALGADHALLAASSTPTTVAITAPRPTAVVWAWLGLHPVGPRGAAVALPPVTVVVRGGELTDWPGFHAAMARAFGFPAWYGASLDAWLDCLTALDEPGAGMTTVHAPPGGVVTLRIEEVDRLATAAPAIFAALVDGVALVNERRRERGLGPVVTLAYAREA